MRGFRTPRPLGTPSIIASALSCALVAALVAVMLLVGQDVVAAAGAHATQSHRGGGVEVKVTPGTLAPDAPAWEFQVVLETHSVTLDGDPAQFATLVDSKGTVHRPLSWAGDPPGGHHRKGVLKFRPLPGETQVELRISGVAGVATRTFRWSLY